MSNSENHKRRVAVKGTINTLQQQVPPTKKLGYNPSKIQVPPKPQANTNQGKTTPKNSSPQNSPKSK